VLRLVCRVERPALACAIGAGQAWYDRQPWLVGANDIPLDAINQLEMFQAATFNPAPNDKELGWLSRSV